MNSQLLLFCFLVVLSSSVVAVVDVADTDRPAVPDHVVVVFFENKDRSQVLADDSGTDYFRWLTTQGLSFSRYVGLTHPSQPNYLLFFSGSDQGCKNDNYPPTGSPYHAPNLATSLLDNGLTFVGYAEDMPAVGATTGTPSFYPRHCPWIPFANVPAQLSQPFTAFPTADYSQLPTVALVVPNICNDAHSCPLSTADAWLRANMADYLAWAQTHNSLLVVTFDEPDISSPADTPIYTVIAGQGVVQSNASACQTVNHFSLQRWLLETYSLPLYNDNLRSATPLPPYWLQPDTDCPAPPITPYSPTFVLIVVATLVALIALSAIVSIIVCCITQRIQQKNSQIEVIGAADDEAPHSHDDQH